MNKQIKKGISLFLLTLVLTAQVGLHLLHHHSTHKHTSENGITLQSDHEHCAACGLDLFFAQDLPAEFSFTLSYTHEGKLIVPATSTASFSLINASGRAPPAC